MLSYKVRSMLNPTETHFTLTYGHQACFLTLATSAFAAIGQVDIVGYPDSTTCSGLGEPSLGGGGCKNFPTKLESVAVTNQVNEIVVYSAKGCGGIIVKIPAGETGESSIS